MEAACDCPHLDRNDPRCAARLTLGHLDEAFSFCLGGFQRCPNFHRINRERAAADAGRPVLRLIDEEACSTQCAEATRIDVTRNGRSLVARCATVVARRLGATGS